MNTYEDLVKGKSLDELLKEAKKCDVKDNQQIITVENNKDLLLRIKDKKENVVFERFYNELPITNHDEFSSSVCYLLENCGVLEREVKLLAKLGRAYYSIRDKATFPDAFNLLVACDHSIKDLLITNHLADYDSFAIQYKKVLDSYETLLPRVLPLKIGMEVRTVEDELTRKWKSNEHVFPSGTIGKVKYVHADFNIGIYFDKPEMDDNRDYDSRFTYNRYELEILELNPRDINIEAFRTLRGNIEEKFARAGK